MENQENTENNFRTAFSGYKPEPPDQVWENLKKELQPSPGAGNRWGSLPGSSPLKKKQWRLIIIAATTMVILSLVIVYFVTQGHQAICGHAYAGEARLCKGTAVLFIIADKRSTLDSVSHYRSAIIDENGFYQFNQVKPGKYLLRVAPVENSEYSKKFLPTWFDHYPEPGEPGIIIISNEDVKADVHLLIRSEIAK